jgi:hypothetical protein
MESPVRTADMEREEDEEEVMEEEDEEDEEDKVSQCPMAAAHQRRGQ